MQSRSDSGKIVWVNDLYSQREQKQEEHLRKFKREGKKIPIKHHILFYTAECFLSHCFCFLFVVLQAFYANFL